MTNHSQQFWETVSTGPVLVTGAAGMVGAGVAQALRQRGVSTLLTPDRTQLDLTDRSSVQSWFAQHRPRYVFMVGAKVGGIAANSADPVAFLTENARMALELFDACHKFHVEKSVFLGSSCIYPRECPQPMTEEMLLTGPLEPTNEGYALAKIVGLKLAEYYARQHGLNVVCPMPCNIYGTGDHFSFQRSHVLSALVRRFVDAVDAQDRTVTVWGTGTARREFVHVDDAVRAILFLFESLNSPEIINVGTGVDVSIRELAERIAREAGFAGDIVWDASKPDGMPRKCLDVSRLAGLGFRATVTLDEGIRRTIGEYRDLKSRGVVQ